MKRTEKSTANGKQGEPKDCGRDKAKHDEKHITEESRSQPVQKHPRTGADVQEGQHELKLGEVVKTIPTIDFNVETVEYNNQSFTVQKDTDPDSSETATQKVKKTVIPQVRDSERGDALFQLEAEVQRSRQLSN